MKLVQHFVVVGVPPCEGATKDAEELAAGVLAAFPAPHVLSKSESIPELLPLFCLPEGVHAVSADSEEAREVRFFTFTLTNSDASRSFGHCCSMMTPVAPGSKQVAPTVLCMLSPLPFPSLFRPFLGLLMRRYIVPLAPETRAAKAGALLRTAAVRPEWLIATYCLCAQAPPPGVRVLADYGGHMVAFQRPVAAQAFPTVDAEAWRMLVACLSPENILFLISALLQEQRVLIHSQYFERLQPVCEALSTLIWPLVWAHVYVPVLPLSLLECLTAPCPFIIGVHTSFLETQVGVEALTTSVIVHLDNDKVVTPMEVELPGGAAVDVLPDVPPHAADIFTAQLSSLCSTHQVNPLFAADAAQPEDDLEAVSTSLGAAEAALWNTVGCKLRPANAMPSQAACAVWNQAAGRRMRRASMLSTDSYVQEARRSTVAAVYHALEGAFPSTSPAAAATQPAPSSRASTGSQSSVAHDSDSDSSCAGVDDAEQDSAQPVSQFTESWTLAVRAAGAHAICAMLQGYRAFLTVRATLPPLLQQALHAHAIVLANALVAQIVEHAERVRAAEKLANTPLPASVADADEPVEGVTPDARQQELLQAHHGSKLSVSPSSKAQMSALGARFKSKWGAMKQRMAKAGAGPLSPAGRASSAMDSASPRPAAPAAQAAGARSCQPPGPHSICRETFAGYARSQAEQEQFNVQAAGSAPPVFRIVEQSSRGLNPRVLGQPLDEFIVAALRPSNARAAEQLQSLEEEAQACSVDLEVEFQMAAFLATRPAEARAFIEPLMQSQAVSGWLEEAALCGRFAAAMNTAIDAAAEREVCSFVHQQVTRLASALLQASPGMTDVDVCLPPAELPLAVPIESAFPSLSTLVGLADCVGHGLFVPTRSSDSRASSRRASSVLAVSAVATPSNAGPSTMLRGFGGAKASARSWKLTVSTSTEEAEAQTSRPAMPAPAAVAAATEPAAAPGPSEPLAAASSPAQSPAEGVPSPLPHSRAAPLPPAPPLTLVRPVPPIQPAPATEVHNVALDGAIPTSELPVLPLTPMLAALQAVTAEQADLTAIARRVREAARAGNAQQQQPNPDMAAAIGKYTCSVDACQMGVPSMDKETLGQVTLFDWLMQRCVASWYARESHQLSVAQEPGTGTHGAAPSSPDSAATPQVGRSSVADMFFTPPTRRSSHARAVRAADMPHQRGASSGDLNSVLTAALGSLSGASSFASSHSASTADDDEPADDGDASSDQHSEPAELIAAAGFTGISQQPQSVARGWADAPTDDFAKFLWVQECAQQASSSGERAVDEQLHEEANSTLVIDVQGAAAELASALGSSLSGPALRESRVRVPAEGLPDLLLQPHLLRALSHIEHDEAGEPHILDNADGMDLDDVVEEDSPDIAELLQVHTPGSRSRGVTADSAHSAGAAQMDWIQAAEAARERTATGSVTRSDSHGFVRTSSYGLDAMRRASMMSAAHMPPSPSASAGAPTSEASSLYTPRSRGNTGSSAELPFPAGDSTPAPVGLSTVRHRRLARRSTLYHTQNPSTMTAARARMEATDAQLSAWWESGANWPGVDEGSEPGVASSAALPTSVGSPEAASAGAHQATAGHLPSPRLRARRPSLLVTGSGLSGSRRQSSMLDIATEIPESGSSSGETELLTAPSGLSGGSKPSPAMAPQSPPGTALRTGGALQSGIASPALTLGSTSSPEPGLHLTLGARSSRSSSSSDEEDGSGALGGGAAALAAPVARVRPQKRQSLTGRLTVPSKAALLEQLGVSAVDVLGSSAAQGAKTRRRSSLYLQLQAQGGFRSVRDDIHAQPPADAAAEAFGHAEAQAQGE